MADVASVVSLLPFRVADFFTSFNPPDPDPFACYKAYTASKPSSGGKKVVLSTSVSVPDVNGPSTADSRTKLEEETPSSKADTGFRGWVRKLTSNGVAQPLSSSPGLQFFVKGVGDLKSYTENSVRNSWVAQSTLNQVSNWYKGASTVADDKISHYPRAQSILGSVVKGAKSAWTGLGESSMSGKLHGTLTGMRLLASEQDPRFIGSADTCRDAAKKSYAYYHPGNSAYEKAALEGLYKVLDDNPLPL